MTKTALWILVLGLGLACGGGLEEAEGTVHTWPVDEPSPDAIEINGELFYEAEPVVDYLDAAMAEETERTEEAEAPELDVEKATYVIPNKYGIAGGGPPCESTGFAGGECKIPKVKTWCVIRITDTESATATMDTSVRRAFPAWKTLVNGLGWSGSHNDVGCAFASNQIRVKFGNLGTGVLGKMSPLINSSDTFTISAGKVIPWTHGVVTIDPSELSAYISGKTTAQKDKATRNIAFHELIHATGLAHNGIVDTLMDASPINPPAVSSYFLGDLSPLAAENTRIQTYSVTP
jgi:hypothetical protein